MPQAGDWGVGIDATPFFQYFGNLLSQNGNPYVPGFAFTAQYPGSLYVKYKPSSKTTLRMIINLGVSYDVDRTPNNSNPAEYNEYKTTALALGAIFGFEKNLSIVGRVNAFYGFQGGVQKIPFTSGTVTGKIEFTNKVNATQNYIEEGGNQLQFVAGGFGGLEFFFLPRVALAGEVGIDLNAYYQDKRESTTGSAAAEIVDYGGFGVNLKPVASGNLSIFIYF